MRAIIAYDLGTGGVKASLFSAEGTILADEFEAYLTYAPRIHFAEQAPQEWWQGICHVTQKLLRRTRLEPESLQAVGLSGHSSVCIPMDKDGNCLLERVPIWYDTRAAEQKESLFRKIDYAHWYSITGNGDPAEIYTLPKLMWLRDCRPDIFSKTHVVLGSKDYINFHLTGVYATDPSYASSFGAFHLTHWDWDDPTLQAAGISSSLLPKLFPSDHVIGFVTADASRETGLPRGIPVVCGAVDNTAMALGTTGLEKHCMYTSLGSSAWIAATTEQPIIDTQTKPIVFAHVKKGLYTSAVSIFSAGNSLRWARDQLCPEWRNDPEAYDHMTAEASSAPAGSHGLLFNPTLAGGSAQEPSANLMGGFAGLVLSHTRADLLRSVMEGIAYSLRSTLDILRPFVPDVKAMLISGGGSKSAFWRQIFADIYHMPITKTEVDQNAASFGAAALAANGCGLWHGYDKVNPQHMRPIICDPNEERNRCYEAYYKVYLEWTGMLAGISDQLMRIKERGCEKYEST